MSVLHDDAILRRDVVRAALDAAGPPIRAADLDKQIELIKLSPERLTDEDLFRMWTVFGTQYRISVGYHASVVLLERPRTVRRAPPALEARLMAVTLRTPVIESVRARAGPRRGHAGDHGAGARLRHGDAPFPGGRPGPARRGRPRDQPHRGAAGLARAGPNTVQAIGSVDLPDGGGRRRFASSDVAAFILAPTITTPSRLPGSPWLEAPT